VDGGCRKETLTSSLWGKCVRNSIRGTPSACEGEGAILYCQKGMKVKGKTDVGLECDEAEEKARN